MGRRSTILVAHDDPAVGACVEASGYRAVSFRRARVAFQYYCGHRAEIDGVIVAQGLEGANLLRFVLAREADKGVVVTARDGDRFEPELLRLLGACHGVPLRGPHTAASIGAALDHALWRRRTQPPANGRRPDRSDPPPPLAPIGRGAAAHRAL